MAAIWRPELHPRDRRGRFRDVFAKILKLDIGQYMNLGKIVQDAPNIQSAIVWRTKDGWEIRGQSTSGTYSTRITPEGLDKNSHEFEDALIAIDEPMPFDDDPKCGCGCGAPRSKTATYLPGHDARHKSLLVKQAQAGDQNALNTLADKNWTKFLDKAKPLADTAVDTPEANAEWDPPGYEDAQKDAEAPIIDPDMVAYEGTAKWHHPIPTNISLDNPEIYGEKESETPSGKFLNKDGSFKYPKDAKYHKNLKVKIWYDEDGSPWMYDEKENKIKHLDLYKIGPPDLNLETGEYSYKLTAGDAWDPIEGDFGGYAPELDKAIADAEKGLDEDQGFDVEDPDFDEVDIFVPESHSDTDIQVENDAAAVNDVYSNVEPYPDLPTCNCGCGGTKSATAKYLPGHDSRHKSALVKAAKEGDQRAYATLEAKGWLKFLHKSTGKSTPATNPNVPKPVKTSGNVLPVLYDYNPERVPVGMPTSPDVYPNYKILDPGPGTKEEQLATLRGRRDTTKSLIDREMLNEVMFRIRGGHVSANKARDPFDSKAFRVKAMLFEAFEEVGMAPSTWVQYGADQTYYVTSTGNIKYAQIPGRHRDRVRDLLRKKTERERLVQKARDRSAMSKDDLFNKTANYIIAKRMHASFSNWLDGLIEKADTEPELSSDFRDIVDAGFYTIQQMHRALRETIRIREPDFHREELDDPPSMFIGTKLGPETHWSLASNKDKAIILKQYYDELTVPTFHLDDPDKALMPVEAYHRSQFQQLYDAELTRQTTATGEGLLSKAEHHDVQFVDHDIGEAFENGLLTSDTPDRGKAIFLQDSPFEDGFIMAYGATDKPLVHSYEENIWTNTKREDLKKGDIIRFNRIEQDITIAVLDVKQVGPEQHGGTNQSDYTEVHAAVLEGPGEGTRSSFHFREDSPTPLEIAELEVKTPTPAEWENLRQGDLIIIPSDKLETIKENYQIDQINSTEQVPFSWSGKFMVVTKHHTYNNITIQTDTGKTYRFVRKFGSNPDADPDPIEFFQIMTPKRAKITDDERKASDVSIVHRAKVRQEDQANVMQVMTELGAEPKLSTWSSTPGVGNQNSWAKSDIDKANTEAKSLQLDLGDGKMVEYNPDIGATKAAPGTISATVLTKAMGEYKSKLEGRKLIQVNLKATDGQMGAVPVVMDADTREIVQIMLPEGYAPYYQPTVDKIVEYIQSIGQTLPYAMPTKTKFSSYRIDGKGVGMFKRTGGDSWWTEQTQASLADFDDVLDDHGLALGKASFYQSDVPFVRKIVTLDKPTMSRQEFLTSVTGMSIEGSTPDVEAADEVAYKHHLQSERRRFIMRGFRPKEAADWLRSTFGARSEPRIPARHIFRGDRTLGHPLPLHDDYADGSVKPIIPEDFTVSHVFSYRGPSDLKRVKSIVATGGLISANEKILRRPWGRYLPGGMSESGDLGSGVSDFIFTVFGNNGYGASGGEFFYKPVTAMRKGSLITDKDYGGQHNRFPKYSSYMRKWGAEFHDGATPSQITDPTRVNQNYNNHNGELDFRYEMPHEDIGVIFINPAAGEKVKEEILKLRDKYAPDAEVFYDRSEARRAAKRMNVNDGFTPESHEDSSIHSERLRDVQIGSIILAGQSSVMRIEDIDKNGSDNWRDWTITTKAVGGYVSVYGPPDGPTQQDQTHFYIDDKFATNIRKLPPAYFRLIQA